MGLHLEHSEFQMAIKWWLGIPVAQGQSSSQCNTALDACGHHALCRKFGGGDVISRHNRLRDIFNDFCHYACLPPQLQTGGWSKQHTRPADVLVPNWVLGKPAALDLSVTSTLNTQVFQEARVIAGSAALAAQTREHRCNDERCRELGWVCIPLVVEPQSDTYELHLNMFRFVYTYHQPSKKNYFAGHYSKYCKRNYMAQLCTFSHYVFGHLMYTCKDYNEHWCVWHVTLTDYYIL